MIDTHAGNVAAPVAEGLSPRVLEQIADVVGPDGVLGDPVDLSVYDTDGHTVRRARPEVVIFPRTTDEVSRLVRILWAARVPFLARGAGTGLSGGAIPIAGGAVLSLVRMKRILDVDIANRTATVQPGLANLNLSKAVDSLGLHFAPDPSSQRACTVGGNISENAGGPHCLKYGPTAQHVLGLTVVLPDGEIARIGGKGEVPAYDLVGLFVGSEGMFGIVTEAIVRLVPKPSAVKTFLAIFGDVAAACEGVSAVVRAGTLPAALELIDGVTMEAVEPFAKAGFPTGAGAALLVELDGRPAEVEVEGRRVVEILRAAGSSEIRFAASEEERARLWAGRKLAFAAYGRVSRNYYVMDGVVPRSRLPAVMRKAAEIAARHGVRVANVLHAGDGNLHPNILFDGKVEGEWERAHEAAAEILGACVAAGGSLTGEHGIGIEKCGYMGLMFSEADLRWMSLVRDVFSPEGLLNPGKVFPTGFCREAPRGRAPEPWPASAWA